MNRIIACLLAAALLLSCASALAEEQAASASDEWNVAVTTPITGNFFTSQWGNGVSDTDVRAMIHGCNLVEWDTAQGMFVVDQTVVSGMAVTEDTEGNRTYTIALYSDMVYSDGTPITAWDYAFTLLLTLSPEMAQLGGTPRRMPYLQGADAYAAGETQVLSGVRVLADDQLSLTVLGDYLPFFYELGLLDCQPYPIAVLAPGVRVADDGQGVYLTNIDETVTEPVFTADLLRDTILDPETGYRTHPAVTSGPYTLVSYEDGVAEFALNPLYKGDANGHKPVIGRVTFRAMAQDELIPALSEGRTNLVNKATSAELIQQGMALMSEDERFTTANYTRSGLAFIAFNADRTSEAGGPSPVAEQAVRQAIAFAMDRDALVSGTVGDFGQRVNGYYGLGQWMYQLLNGTISYPVELQGEGAEAETAYEEALAAWEALSLDTIEPYAQDVERAAALLDETGWNLNQYGDAFAPGQGEPRFRADTDGLQPLSLRLAYAEGSAAGPFLETVLVENLRAVGIELTVEAIPMSELLPQYYHSRESGYDMFFLATNFDLLYDPSASFSETEDGGHVWTVSGIADEEMWAAAVAMRQTQPGDLMSYCASWLAFQRRFAQVLPAIPVYSNIYFDFYPSVLQNYAPASTASWPQALIPAYVGEPQPAEAEDEGEIEFLD